MSQHFHRDSFSGGPQETDPTFSVDKYGKARFTAAFSPRIELPETASATVGVLEVNGVAFLHGYKPPNNTGENAFLGGAGNFTMGGSVAQSGWTAVTNGSGNVGVGVIALENNERGFYNVGVGWQALRFNTDGYLNTAVGTDALRGNTTGRHNTGLGGDAGYSQTTANRNTLIGFFSNNDNLTGEDIVSIGAFTLENNLTSFNTGVGAYAARANTTGGNLVAVGYQSAFSNATGSNFVSVGMNSLYYNTTATNVTALGVEAGRGAASYSSSGGTYVGYQSGYQLATGGNNNTLVGLQSGYNLTTGTRNVIVGGQMTSTAIHNLTTGNKNVMLGSDLSFPSATADGQLNIGNLIYGTGLDGSGSTLSTGNIGIGVQSPGAKFTLANGASGIDTELIRFNRTTDANRYNSIFSKSDDSGNATMTVKMHDGVSATSQVVALQFTGDGYTILRGNTAAVADAKLAASQLALHVNEAGNALTFKVKYADGTTIKTGTVTLA